ncbi:hypothetical protein [Peribacillus simplex]|uniref:hypothetical protein n=1 Tax=Peribacillus simplex TaxID=1478 RepID=UPI0009705731|nr:hypothetical protein [Peribacillus simplex]
MVRNRSLPVNPWKELDIETLVNVAGVLREEVQTKKGKKQILFFGLKQQGEEKSERNISC